MLKRIARPLGAFLFALLVAEFAAFAAIRVLQARGLVYREPTPPNAQEAASYRDYVAKRDPLLGWPFPSQRGGDFFDASGARRNPEFEDPAAHPACVTLFGDSFTQGARVDHRHAWSNLLSSQLGCRVANYGQGGYGTDQAYLRFKQKSGGTARWIVLGHLSENILRNATRCRDLYTSSMEYALKPRFLLDATGRLRLLPIPELSEQEYRRLLGVEGPPLILDHEFFNLGGAAGIALVRFPYVYSAVRSARDYRLRASIARRPPYAEFYDPNHPAGGLAITAEILRSFAQEVEGAGKRPLIILFATQPDLDWRRKTGLWSYQALLDRLAKQALPVLDLGPRLEAELAGRETADFFEQTGHYNEQGNRFVARVVYEYLQARQLPVAARVREKRSVRGVRHVPKLPNLAPIRTGESPPPGRHVGGFSSPG